MKNERTFVMVKPDGVVKGLIGEIISRIEQRGLKVVAIKMYVASRDQIDGHYPNDDAYVRNLGEHTKNTYEKYGLDLIKEYGTDDSLVIGKLVRGWILDFMTAGPVVTMVVEGLHAVEMVRKLVGATIPSTAAVGTIRGDYSVDSPALANAEHRAISNLIHASGDVAEAEREIKHWFKPEEIVSYRRGEIDVLFAPKEQ